MATIARFEELEVWQVSKRPANGVYRAAKTQPLRNNHVLCDQLKRAVVSASSNLAEGFERGTRKQNIEFCDIAKGSLGELRRQVLIAHEVELLDARASKWLIEKREECSKLLSGYIRVLQRTASTCKSLKYGPAEPAT